MPDEKHPNKPPFCCEVRDKLCRELPIEQVRACECPQCEMYIVFVEPPKK